MPRHLREQGLLRAKHPHFWGRLSLRALEGDEKGDLLPAGRLVAPDKCRLLFRPFTTAPSSKEEHILPGSAPRTSGQPRGEQTALLQTCSMHHKSEGSSARFTARPCFGGNSSNMSSPGKSTRAVPGHGQRTVPPALLHPEWSIPHPGPCSRHPGRPIYPPAAIPPGSHHSKPIRGQAMLLKRTRMRVPTRLRAVTPAWPAEMWEQHRPRLYKSLLKSPSLRSPSHSSQTAAG